MYRRYLSIARGSFDATPAARTAIIKDTCAGPGGRSHASVSKMYAGTNDVYTQYFHPTIEPLGIYAGAVGTHENTQV